MQKYVDRYTLALVALGALLIFGLANVTIGNASPLGVATAYVGKNPTGWSRQWCGKFMDYTLRKSGKRGGGNKASAYARYGRASGCRKGAIAVMSTHVGYVVSCSKGSVRVLSGNHSGKAGNRKVGYGNYRRSRIIAFRMP